MDLEKYERILRHPYLQTSYLDSFDLRHYSSFPGMTAIIPTYNRAPHTPEADSNPLGWCLESLIAQEGLGLSEIVVVDDNSGDFTEQVVGYFSDISPFPIRYHKNSRNFGSSISKNIGISMAKNDWILFLDDDCIFSKYLFFGAGYTFSLLNENAAALHLPVYHRKTTPDPLDMGEIGNVDYEKGVITSNFNGFPLQYSDNLEESFVEGDLKILKPFKIRNLAGIFLAKKNLVESVGGYPDFFTWKNKYREETYLALRLDEAGHQLFFTPDPKFFCVHLKYGALSNEDTASDLDPHIRRLVNQSNKLVNGTGNRVDPEEWFFSRIISTFVTLGISDRAAAERYLLKTQKEFVEENKLAVSGLNNAKIQDRDDRRKIFDKAKREGNDLLRSIAGGYR